MSLFVTFEGTEGSGKSTQIALLAQSLSAHGYDVVTTREPGGTLFGERLRSFLLDESIPIGPEAEAYLMTAARAEHVKQIIRPALSRGAVVVCDRFVDSTLAYQGGGRGLSVSRLCDMQELAIGDTWPNLTIFLDVPVDVGLRRRMSEMNINRLDREDHAFHERVLAWYREAALQNPARWCTIDATPQVEFVHTEVLECVMKHLAGDVPLKDCGGSSP